jgi:hypothetical protein
MVKLAVVRWYLNALYLRALRLRDRWLRPRALNAIDANLASSLFTEYESIAEELSHVERLQNREFKVFSQNGEDGLLAYIFSEIGTTNRRFVEFGVEDGRECNCANLAIHFGWSGLMLEANPADVHRARVFYGRLRGEDGPRVAVEECLVTIENINEAIAAGRVTGEIDLLSIDIDGNDYWIWEAIDVVSARVVVIEYNASFGRRSISIAYDPGFVRFKAHRSGWYHGASLAALTKLSDRKGYDLIGTDSFGVNAFFVRRDVPKGRLEALEADEAYRPQRKRMKVATLEQQFAAIEHLAYVDV